MWSGCVSGPRIYASVKMSVTMLAFNAPTQAFYWPNLCKIYSIFF